MGIIEDPNKQMARCPHCKQNDFELKLSFMYESQTRVCSICEKQYTVELFINPQLGVVVNVSTSIRDEKIKVSDFAKNLDNNITDTDCKGE